MRPEVILLDPMKAGLLDQYDVVGWKMMVANRYFGDVIAAEEWTDELVASVERFTDWIWDKLTGRWAWFYGNKYVRRYLWKYLYR